MNKRTKLTWAAIAATLLAAGVVIPSAQAQSADALLDKLVEKGVISVKEANELRDQSDEAFNKAYQAKTGLPDWVTQLKFYGDVRGRWEMFRMENDDPGVGAPNKDRDRLRYRLRMGATVQMKEGFELGFRVTSGEPSGTFGGDPISGNTTMQDNGSKKFVYMDLAYGKWTPINTGPWLLSGSIGKMENPFTVSDMVFDADYTPEGVALQGGYTINDKHALKLSGGLFILDEIAQGAEASNDPLMYGIQGRWDGKWTPKLASTLGVGWFAITEATNLGNGAVPNVNVGNTRDAAGNLPNDYYPVVIDAGVTYTLDSFPLYPGTFPIRVAGEYMNNPGADEDNQGMWGGIFFGKSGKKGAWEVSWRYKKLERDAQYEEFVDSDFGAYYAPALANSAQGAGYRSGTGIQGHIVKAVYSVSDSFSVGATWFYTELIDAPLSSTTGKESESAQHRVQVDAVWKF